MLTYIWASSTLPGNKAASPIQACRDWAWHPYPAQFPGCHPSTDIGTTMKTSDDSTSAARMELANRLFFRLYQCANMLHKTGSRAVEDLGITTQQWAVLGALSRREAQEGMSVGDLARYLMVSRQSLSGLVSRMERDGHLSGDPDGRDRRSRLITMTESGRQVWNNQAIPRINDYYEQALEDFSVGDLSHTLHYLLKLLENMKRLDGGDPAA